MIWINILAIMATLTSHLMNGISHDPLVIRHRTLILHNRVHDDLRRRRWRRRRLTPCTSIVRHLQSSTTTQ
ncbi:hypothetical protein PVAP13_9NG413628 [Panicum virgatum]|uniref:Secreted protein n=1 Tax=Panicum virgatum TaxID=38727 RepID=A0A8T0MP84_PANVG|nr:hypothetical protein PVAP13_9NG413628 [Panicum virgatum]